MSDKLREFHQTWKEIDDLYHHYAKSFGLSDTAFWILYFMRQSEKPCTQRDLCDEWYYSPQTVHSALKTLEKQGLIYLSSTTTNRKNKQIHFTAEGNSYANQVITPLIQAENKSFDLLSDSERDLLISISQTHAVLLRKEINQILELSSED